MSKKNRKIFIVGFYGGSEYINWIPQSQRVFDMKEADLVLFTGGEDVDPSVYHKDVHPTTASNIFRDEKEIAAFKEAKNLGKPMLGICRGAQLLCVMNGGILVQHQENNSFIHKMKTANGVEVLTSSCHHQAAYPFLLPEKKYKILGWTEKHSRFHFGQSYQEELNPPKECEVVYYPKFRCLGYQGHPEMTFGMLGRYPQLQESIDYCRNLLQLQENPKDD